MMKQSILDSARDFKNLGIDDVEAACQALLIAVEHLEMIQKYCPHPYAKEKAVGALSCTEAL